jgi:hypothetical protein
MSSAAATTCAPSPAVEDLAPDPERFVSEQEYWERWYEAETAYEWNNGRLEEKPVSDQLTYLAYPWFLELLDFYLAVHPVAQPTGLEMGFRMALPGTTVIRKPDLGVVRNDNPVPLKPLDRSYRGIFDLCVEALSDSSRKEMERDTLTKKAEYLAAGVPEYYILHHDTGRRAFYALGRRGVYDPIPAPGGIVRSRVLPGFRFRADDLARRPSVEPMLEDDVYRGFVFPGWQADRSKALAEARARREAEQRAGLEAKRADRAERRADAAQAEVARLKVLLASKNR